MTIQEAIEEIEQALKSCELEIEKLEENEGDWDWEYAATNGKIFAFNYCLEIVRDIKC